MNTPQRPTCRTCPYWECDEHTSQEEVDRDAYSVAGTCHRHANMQQRHRGSRDWCGEHPKFPEYLVQLELAESMKP